jgi:pyruvate dehydrogenase complex dehydrogenase (E1) component
VKVLIAALLLAAVSASASAQQFTPIALEAGFDAALLTDYQQSRRLDGFCNGRVDCTMHETNFLLGRCPEAARLHNYFATAAITHGLISYALPAKYRTLWQGSTLAIEFGVVAHNRHIGLKWNY